MLELNNNFELISVKTKVTGKVYKPHLRTLEMKYTQALNKDLIQELAITNNQKELSKIPSYLTALSTDPILSFNKSNKNIEDSKTLLKLVFKVKSPIKDVEHYFVLNGYCKNIVDLYKVTNNIKFIPTYSFEQATSLNGTTIFGNEIEYISLPKVTGKISDFIISRPSDILNSIHTLKVKDSNIFSHSQYTPFIRKERVLVNRENINPINYLSKIFNLSKYPIHAWEIENTYTPASISYDKANIYASILNEKEPLYSPNRFPFDLIGINSLSQNADIYLTDIIESYPNFFNSLTVIKEPLVDYTLTTEKFGKSDLPETLSQELVLNALEAISKAGLESLHLKGSNLKCNSEEVVTFTLTKGISEYSKFNNTPEQIKSVCNQLKNQFFTKLIGLVPKDKINITFDLNITSFGVTLLNVQFPTEVGIRGKVFYYAFPTYNPANWSPLVTTIQETGSLAERIYTQLRLLNIYI